MRVPWTARRSNQSILKISPEDSLEGLMLKLKLKLQYFGHLMRRPDSFEKTLMLRKKEKGMTEDEMVGWYHRCYSNSMDMSLSKLRELSMDRQAGMLQSTGLQRVGHD